MSPTCFLPSQFVGCRGVLTALGDAQIFGPVGTAQWWTGPIRRNVQVDIQMMPMKEFDGAGIDPDEAVMESDWLVPAKRERLEMFGRPCLHNIVLVAVLKWVEEHAMSPEEVADEMELVTQHLEKWVTDDGYWAPR